MKIEISIGELLDKISILFIKQQNIPDQNKLININKELNHLTEQANYLFQNDRIIVLYSKLIEVNQELWNIEDKIRFKEKLQEFDGVFIELARSIYKLNDQRANIKKEINMITQSNFIEEKYHSSYIDL